MLNGQLANADAFTPRLTTLERTTLKCLIEPAAAREAFFSSMNPTLNRVQMNAKGECP
jgi:hypothetical protein